MLYMVFRFFFCCIAMHHQWMFLLIWWESVLLPACEFGGEFAEQVRSGPAADIRRQGSSIMAEGGRCGRRSIGGRDTVTELTPVEGATDGGSTCQPTALTWGRGGGCSRSDNTESRGRGGREAVRQGAEKRHKQTQWMRGRQCTGICSTVIERVCVCEYMCLSPVVFAVLQQRVSVSAGTICTYVRVSADHSTSWDIVLQQRWDTTFH